MIARLAAFIAAAVLSTLTYAQGSASDALDRFHRAVVTADRALAESVLAADVQIFESGFVERSRDEYLSHHFEADAKFAKEVTRKVTAHRVETVGNMALAMEETETSGSYDGKPIRLIGTETAVLRLDGGHWKIVHLHWSSRKPKP